MALRILLTVDGSALAERAVPVAAALARASGASVDALCVADQDPIDAAENRDAEQALAVAGQAASAVALALRRHGVEAEPAAVVDRPVEGILRFASARGDRLLVMATHGRGGLGRWLHGSVARDVVRRSPVPVVLVRAWEGGAVLQPPDGPTTIVVPLDGSAMAEAALPPARWLAELCDGNLVLVQAVRLPVAVADATGVADAMIDAGALIEAEREAARSYLELQTAALPDGVPVATAVETGPTADAIVSAVVARHASLVVMATHGHGAVYERLLGGTAEHVVRFSPCPVALVRPDLPSAVPSSSSRRDDR